MPDLRRNLACELPSRLIRVLQGKVYPLSAGLGMDIPLHDLVLYAKIMLAQPGLRGSINHHVLLVIASYDGCADIHVGAGYSGGLPSQGRIVRPWAYVLDALPGLGSASTRNERLAQTQLRQRVPVHHQREFAGVVASVIGRISRIGRIGHVGRV